MIKALCFILHPSSFILQMNILVFTTLWPNCEQPNFGLFVKNRIEALARLDGVVVRVVAPVPYFPARLQSSVIPAQWRMAARIPDSELIAGVKTYHPRYLVTPKIGMTFYSRWMARAAWDLVQNLHSERPIDLIDAHYVYPDGHAAASLGERLKIPVVITARGTDINLFSRMPLIRPMIRRALTRARRVVAVSGALKERIVELGIEADKIAVIRNGVDRSTFYPRDRMESRRKLGLDAVSRIILAVGALVPLKRIDLLIDAMAALNDKNARLYVIGEGSERAALEERIAKNNLAGRVFLIGARRQSELADWYSAADLFCLASSREGCPNVVIEAMACGIPIVATDVGGVRELAANRSLGRIVFSPSPEQFAREIGIALESNWSRDEIAAFGGSRSWDDVAAELFSYLRSAQAR